eukprot:3955095-Prorocentrum_lima.AAC.1
MAKVPADTHDPLPHAQAQRIHMCSTSDTYQAKTDATTQDTSFPVYPLEWQVLLPHRDGALQKT